MIIGCKSMKSPGVIWDHKDAPNLKETKMREKDPTCFNRVALAYFCADASWLVVICRVPARTKGANSSVSASLTSWRKP